MFNKLMKKRNLWWQLHQRLMTVLDEQTLACINQEPLLYEQARLDCLEIIEVVQRECYGVTQKIEGEQQGLFVENMADEEVEAIFQ